MTGTVVSVDWLKNHLSDPDLVILDTSPKSNKSGLTSELENLQIPNAKYFDLKNVFSDQKAEFPNTMPSIEKFEEGCQQLGINNTSKIVVYDNLGIYASPRVWWMFKVMGHNHVAVLDGGLPEWVSQGNATEAVIHRMVKTGDFEAQASLEKIKDYQFIKSNITNQRHLVIDARSSGRFDGTAPEPREGLKSGHIPNSVNLPFQNVLSDHKFKSPSELKKLFEELNVKNQPLSFSCGSGLTACIILLASEMVQDNETSVYDGSWTEWAQLEDENL